ncbi:hypothetical protein [Microbacterium trichothecenolyticum]|uniref:Nitrate ABC transporter substrate-binding protein n=1 Tax=Microbacterium trichothecenolyticum TaxID=69370 RepID=A0ABU0TQD1_MICTR|nr:hypothetical protein [Microbacterium trichothecenolyticum]MDQ1121873.1 hypothetical protein [Microbacterium trichothecenolyticum]
MRRAPLTLVFGAIALATLAGCSSPAAPPIAQSSAPAVEAPAASTPDVSPSADVDDEEPTCENIIPKTTADDFKSLGWSSQSEPFRIGAIQLENGIQCKWGDQKITTDRVQMFGWAEIDDADAAKAEKELVAAGWRRESGTAGTYVTENPEWAIGKDADGYGITYLFGDGWVKLADTRQSLVLVDAPR